MYSSSKEENNEISIIEEKKIDSLNRFSEFYKNLGNRDMYNYYLKRIDNLEIRLNYLKKIKKIYISLF